MSVPVDPEKRLHFGNDGLASSSLMSDFVKDPKEISASSCELGQLYQTRKS